MVGVAGGTSLLVEGRGEATTMHWPARGMEGEAPGRIHFKLQVGASAGAAGPPVGVCVFNLVHSSYSRISSNKSSSFSPARACTVTMTVAVHWQIQGHHPRRELEDKLKSAHEWFVVNRDHDVAGGTSMGLRLRQASLSPSGVNGSNY